MTSEEAFADWWEEEFGFPMEETDVAYLGSIRSAWEHAILFEAERQKQMRKQIRKDRAERRKQRLDETEMRRREYIERHRVKQDPPSTF